MKNFFKNTCPLLTSVDRQELISYGKRRKKNITPLIHFEHFGTFCTFFNVITRVLSCGFVMRNQGRLFVTSPISQAGQIMRSF